MEYNMNNKENWKKWKIYKKKIIHYFKDGFKSYIEPKYLSLFNFNEEWAYLPDGQKQLEKSRLNIINTDFFEIKRFAQLYTKKIYIPKTLEITKYIEKSFFDTVLLQAALCIIYSYIPNTEDEINQLEIDYQLHLLLTRYLDIYFEKRKKLKIKKEWLQLPLEERVRLVHQLIHILWLNLKRLNIVISINKSIFNQKKNEQEIRPFIIFHPEFDTTILGTVPFIFHDLPCVQYPKDWKFINNSLVSDGGYHTYNTEFIRRKIYFKGISKPKSPLINIINKLQKMEWTIDPSIMLPYFRDSEFKELLEYLETNEKKIKRNTDIFQVYNTMLFLTNFCNKFKQFYFVYNIDARGRIYNSSDWAFSPTSSKLMRKYIRLKTPIELTPSSEDWYYLKIGKLLDLEHNTNSQLLTDVKQNPTIESLKKIINIKNYDEFRIHNLLSDIENKISDQLIEADCTSSAIQILAILTNSKKLMQLTNLIGEGAEDGTPYSQYEIKDFYKYIIKQCNQKLPDSLFNRFLDRSLIKSLIMPKAYSKTAKASKDDLMSFIRKNKDFYHDVLTCNDTILYEIYQTYNTKKYKNSYHLPNQEFNYNEYINKKIYLFSACFFQYLEHIYYTEFPEIKEIEQLFQGKDAPLRNFAFETPFLSFSNKYNTYENYPLKNMYENKIYYHSFPHVTAESNYVKESNAAIANAAHFLDAWVNQRAIQDLMDYTNIIPVHDSWHIHPKYMLILQNSVKASFQTMLEYVQTIPELKHFHQEKLITINSNNIIKIDS